MKVCLDRLPRTIELVRAKDDPDGIPDGFPILVLVDQSRLPEELEYLRITDWRQVIEAIKSLKVRGAPAIGIAGAAALALRGAEFCYALSSAGPQDEYDFDRVFVIDEERFDKDLYLMSMEYTANMIKDARPTAVNLAWATDRAMRIVREGVDEGFTPKDIEERLFGFVEILIAEDEAANRAMGQAGAALLPDNACLLTHCNAGSLATAFFGTALGVVYAAAEGRGVERVYADETRPVGQGARLTAWELARAGVSVTLICDDMAASVLSSGKIDAVVVGADRIAANGDVANKIGTLGVAILASHYNVPFYVVAPTSTVDLSLESGSAIPIEQRSPQEVLAHPIEGVEVANPAFDITSAELITAIVTEAGVYVPSEISRIVKEH